MEFHEKLQELRKQKGLTQEELAQQLFVSRTAVSKWESGRGYPGIDSLKAISRFYAVTIDDLLSGDELLTIAQEDTRRQEQRVRDLVFGLLDSSVALFFFLPLLGQKNGEVVRAVSLLSLEGIQPYLKAAYFGVVLALVLTGIVTFALQNHRGAAWLKVKAWLSLLLNGVGVLLFIISQQPYAAAFLFTFLMIKVLMGAKIA